MNKNTRPKQVSINLLSNTVSFTINMLISFILTPFLINALGKDVYSFYPLANSIVVYMAVLMNSFNSIASRYISIAILEKKDLDAHKYFSSTFFVNIILSIIILIPMTITILFLEFFIDIPINYIATVKLLFIFIFSSAIVNVISSVFGVATFVKNRIDLRAFREIVTSLMKIILFYYLYTNFETSIIYVGIVTLIIALVNFAFQWVYTKKLLPGMFVEFKSFSLAHSRKIFNSSVWILINTLGNNLLCGITIILGNILFDSDVAGDYSIVFTITQLFNSVIIMLCSVFYPILTNSYINNSKDEQFRLLKFIQTFIGYCICSFLAVFIVLLNDFYVLWMPNEDAFYLAKITIVSIIPYFFISCFWSITNMNILYNKLKVPALIVVFIGLFNLGITPLVVICFNLEASTIVIFSTILQIVWIGILIPLYYIKYSGNTISSVYSPLIKCLLSTMICLIIFSFFKSFIVVNSWFNLILCGSVLGIIALAISFFCCFNIREIKDFVMKAVSKKNSSYD